ncbi:MAG: hypothetical protein Q8O99_01015 [bacterium]|nr:hypothetical protein [bacterium]
MSDGGLFNVLKSGLQPVTTQDSAFDTNVKVLDTFGSSYLYTLSTTPTSGNAHLSITRYPNQRGSQDAFQAGIKYEMQPNEEFINASSGMTSLAIDGTFLLRSQINQSLRQLRRPSAAPTLLVRKVPLVGGDTMRAP